jgi:CRP-like cAMP-binding protein
VGKLAKNAFDPKAFLARVGTGKKILKFEKNQHVFAQGDVADSVFYLQEGRVPVESVQVDVVRRVRKDRALQRPLESWLSHCRRLLQHNRHHDPQRSAPGELILSACHAVR